MKERPILFSGAMVRAILNGTKTQTRRVVKPRKDPDMGCELSACELAGEVNNGDYSASPYKIGNRLWVKETTIKVEDHGYIGPVYAESEEGRAMLEYGLGPVDDASEVEPHDLKLRPSIFMPRSMSRITLEITDVRVERLQEITRGDCMSEGCPFPNIASGDDPRTWYRDLWEAINGAGSWDANPFVWVIEFKRVEQ